MALLHKIRKRLSCQLGNSIISWTSWRESCSWLHVFSNWVLLCSCQAELVQVLKRNQVGRGGLQSSMLWTFVLPWSQVCSERGGHSGRGYCRMIPNGWRKRCMDSVNLWVFQLKALNSNVRPYCIKFEMVGKTMYSAGLHKAANTGSKGN